MKMKKCVMIATCVCTLIGMGNLTFLSAETIPQIQNTGNQDMETKLNKEIENNFVNKEEEEKKLSITTSFEEKFRDEKMLSFVLTIVESQASSSIKKLYYNTNLETGEPLTLKGLLGKNYKELADNIIKEEIKKRMTEDENQIFFGVNQEDKELGIEGFNGIKEDQTFYINQEGNVVITFEQFEIAPGYMGIPEFEISK